MTYAETLGNDLPVAERDVRTRALFLFRTYNHLMASILAFTGMEFVLFQSGIAQRIAPSMLSAWWAVLGAFLVVGWLATGVAHQARSKFAQYAALTGFVAAEALIFAPLIWIANHYAPGVLTSAAWVTILGFAGLTGIVFTLRKDFSFLGGLLRWVGFAIVIGIFVSIFAGFQLGTWFSVGMIVFAGASILYSTSQILNYYPEDRYVAASLELFAGVALLFWYVLRLFMSLKSE
jgi:hypothetical protein